MPHNIVEFLMVSGWGQGLAFSLGVVVRNFGGWSGVHMLQLNNFRIEIWLGGRYLGGHAGRAGGSRNGVLCLRCFGWSVEVHGVLFVPIVVAGLLLVVVLLQIFMGL